MNLVPGKLKLKRKYEEIKGTVHVFLSGRFDSQRYPLNLIIDNGDILICLVETSEYLKDKIS